VFIVAAFPLAAVSGFGRLEPVFYFGAQWCALLPGWPGDCFRAAFYRLTLKSCAADTRIQFGSFFAHPHAVMGRGVYIGCHCVMGRADIGDRTQIASGVQIISGRKQHGRASDGRILGAEHDNFETIAVGADCWIGAGAILMADVGARTTIGAGSVVAYPIPSDCIAVGNPAKVVRRLNEGVA